MVRCMHRRGLLTGIAALGAASACSGPSLLEASDIASPLPSDPRAAPRAQSELEPAWLRTIDGLWFWGWAGENDEHCTVAHNPPRIVRLADISGNGHHFYRDDDVISSMPPYDRGLERSGDGWSYRTRFTPITRHRYNDGRNTLGHHYNQVGTMQLTDEFYLVAAMMNTRNAGDRDMWGRSHEYRIVIHQSRNRFAMVFDSIGRGGSISPRGSVPKGPLLAEIGRTRDNIVKVWVNGVDVGNDVERAGAFELTGFGYKGSGHSGFDDMCFEILNFTRLPSAEERTRIRAYLNAKWHLYET